MLKNNNPYNEYFESNPKDFVGRVDEIQDLIQDIARPYGQSHIEIIGLPEVGKTRLVSHVKFLLTYEEKPNLTKLEWQGDIKKKYNYLTLENLLVVQVDFRQTPSDTHPFLFLYNTFQYAYNKYLLEASMVNHSLPVIERHEIFNNTDEIIRRISADVTILLENSIRTVLLLDDFDKIFENQKVVKNEVNLLRAIRDQVSIVLFTEQSLAKTFPEIASSPFFQSMPLRYLGCLKYEDIREFIAVPASRIGVTIPKDDIDFVAELSGGFPYLVIHTAQALWDIRVSLNILEKNIPLTQIYREALVGQLNSDFQRSFRLYWEILEPIEQKALKDLVEDPARKTKEIISTFRLLKQKGILKGDLNNSIKCFSPLFEGFIQSQLATLQPKLTDGNKEIALTSIEQNLLDYLKNNKDRVCTYDELLSNVWSNSSEHRYVIQTAISRLRKKIKQLGEGSVQLESNVGYRFFP